VIADQDQDRLPAPVDDHSDLSFYPLRQFGQFPGLFLAERGIGGKAPVVNASQRL
jgi:hypothetical protein